MSRYLDRIEVPKDLKMLSKKELSELCGEIRELMITRLGATGGHIGSNLGMIEATVALHYVFDSPVDQIIFDVSHQCYTHKLLTGRKSAYLDPEEYDSVSGFTNPAESEHDIFSIGHTSTAISLASGLAKSRDLKGEKNNVIAVVGDGALSGGEALEGLNNAATLGSNLIIVINDNDMSIAENHGGLYQNLRLLRETGGTAECNLFRALGLDYCFIRNGNNINTVIDVLSRIKHINHPIVVHMCTMKGYGYLLAERNKENWHYKDPFDVGTGKVLLKTETHDTYENLTRDFLVEKMQKDSTIVAITAGTPKIFGFDENLRKQYSKQFVDVGIAEEHAIAMASGIAKNGGKPVFGVSSSFLQRAYDQLSQDLALNHSPAVILVFFAGISQGSQTHMGIFDIALAINIPNLIYLAPTCKEEYFHMLEWGLEQNENSVMIRVPGIVATSRNVALLSSYSQPVQYEVVEQGRKVAILALGKFFSLGKGVKDRLEEATGIKATLINPRYITGVDVELLEQLKENHQLVIILEDGVIDGGFGEKIARYYGCSSMKVLNFGARKEFVDWVTVEEQYEKYHLTVEQIVSDIFYELKSPDFPETC
ncbi:MAG: 1-deoxy-D-xylulose-5-phosphate synthase [Lachnospiraceae bacterium]|nr:1-deoxy-D-xylulose-5-phosphate synthase [Lachnospiraceae bacterium]